MSIDITPPYERYAPLYDGSGQVRFALLAYSYLHELLALHPVHGQQALDLACGTGTLVGLLADAGWLVTGVDRSTAMLAQASAKLAASPGSERVYLIQADLRRLIPALPPAAFNLALCTYDSLNYLLTAEDLAACFHGVAATLAPGGLFIADMNTRHFLAHDWGECAIHEQAGYVQIERSQFDPANDSNTMLLTGFVGDDQRGYQRFDELHTERAYPPELVNTLLIAAGLSVEGTYDSFTLSRPGPRTQRIFWAARKADATI